MKTIVVPVVLFFSSFLFFWQVLPRLPGFERKGGSPLAALLFAFAHVVTACLGVFLFGALLYVLFWMALGGGAQAASSLFGIILGVELLTFFGITAGLIFALRSETTYLIRRRFAAPLAALLLIALEGAAGFGVGTLFSDHAKAGYIDKAGKFVIQPRFVSGDDFHEGVAEVRDELSPDYYFIDKSGNKTEPSSRQREKHVFRVSDDAVRAEFKSIKIGSRAQFSEGLAIARDKVHNGYGFIDETETMVIPPIYENARPFHDGIAAASIGSVWGYIDRQGKWVIKPQFASAESFSDGLGCVSLLIKKDPSSTDPEAETVERHGYIDKTGKFVLPVVFKYAHRFSEGLACVTIDTSSPSEELQKLPSK